MANDPAPMPTLPMEPCPVCAATDALVQRLEHRDAMFVECVNCRVFVATRKAFRHFEYLRWRGDPDGVDRLRRLAAHLKARPPHSVLTLEYDTWQDLLDKAPSTESR